MGISNYIGALGPDTQREQADPRQVKNDGGGYSFQLDDFGRLERFLILGSEGGSFYVSERKLTRENAKCVDRCLTLDAKRTIDRIVEISDSGRAPKNDPAILALAIASASADPYAKRLALMALPKVCRIGTHLYHFVAFARTLRGWGPSLRKAVASWFNEKDPQGVAYQLAKYPSRDGWSAKDLLRLSHPRPRTPDHKAIYRWATAGYDSCGADGLILPPFLEALEECKKPGITQDRLCKLIRDYKMPRECVPTQHLKNPAVWDALLPHMGLTAMIRNLGNMTKIGLLSPLSDAALRIQRTIVDEEALRKAKVHPMTVLIAMKTYALGRGIKGDGVWTPVQGILDGLDQAFYASFGNVEPCGKKIVLGVDCSGSMDRGDVAGVTGITPRVAAAAMALITANAEPTCHMLGYHQEVFDLPISPTMRLDQAVTALRGPSKNTDCALPILWAQERLSHGVTVDAFVNYTDNETFIGRIHPHVALQLYRRTSGVAARAACVGMVANQFTIMDPTDAGCMNVAGFDAAVPQIISDFLGGK